MTGITPRLIMLKMECWNGRQKLAMGNCLPGPETGAEHMNSSSEVLVFDDLQPYLLLKNGNFLYRVPFQNGWALLKVYYGSRGVWGNLTRSLDNWLSGQTSYMPRTRLRVEQGCIELWRRHGFRVFETYPDVKVTAPGCPPGGYMLFEYVDCPKLDAFLRDESRSVEERLTLYRRFLPEWSRRHELAVAEREPRLVHENGDGKHVMILNDGRFLWFDFEMVYRSRGDVALHVSHEIIQYIWFLMRNTPQEISEELIRETVAHYPRPKRLQAAYDFFFQHPKRGQRLARALDRRLRARARRADSKYSVALRLWEELEGRS